MNYFYPFDVALRSGKPTDFDITAIADLLDLRPVQRELLAHILRRVEITIWASGSLDDGDEPPHLALLVFLDGEVVAETDVAEFFESVLEDRNHTGDAAEIAALESICEICLRGIKLRKDEPS